MWLDSDGLDEQSDNLAASRNWSDFSKGRKEERQIQKWLDAAHLHSGHAAKAQKINRQLCGPVQYHSLLNCSK
jgi:hypothetical protein